MGDTPFSQEDQATRPIQGRTVFSVPSLKLHWEDGGRTATFLSNRVCLGSGPDNQFVIQRDTVSRSHAEIRRHADQYLICDTGATNGLFVNDVRVREAYLEPGDIIRLGEELVQFSPGDEVLHAQPATLDRLGPLVGASPAMQALFGLIQQVAPTDAPVLLEGETGTGKELAARTVHELSLRKHGPFVVLDCSALPPSLVESELFGHEKGSFSGAIAGRKGLLEIAHEGTLFLDEIGELPLDLQPRLLRALETGEVRRVGSPRTQLFDFRVVSATNRNLPRLVQEGRFRQDLFFRINVVPIRLPPLRERREDIPLLVEHLLEKRVADTPAADRPQVERFSDSVLQVLQRHSFPGNVRELVNVVHREVSLAASSQVDALRIPLEGAGQPAPAASQRAFLRFGEAKAQAVEAFESEYLELLMQVARGNISRAARMSGMDRKYLRQLLKRYDMYEGPDS